MVTLRVALLAVAAVIVLVVVVVRFCCNICGNGSELVMTTFTGGTFSTGALFIAAFQLLVVIGDVDVVNVDFNVGLAVDAQDDTVTPAGCDVLCCCCWNGGGCCNCMNGGGGCCRCVGVNGAIVDGGGACSSPIKLLFD